MDTKSMDNHCQTTKGDNAKSKTRRVVIFVRDTSSGLFYISIKYHKYIPKDL